MQTGAQVNRKVTKNCFNVMVFLCVCAVQYLLHQYVLNLVSNRALLFTISIVILYSHSNTCYHTALMTAQITPDHLACSFLIPYQLHREHTTWLLIGAHNRSTDSAITDLTVPFVTCLVWRDSGNGLSKGPHYYRFSLDSSPWSSDHWYSSLTNSATVATLKYTNEVLGQSMACGEPQMGKWAKLCPVVNLRWVSGPNYVLWWASDGVLGQSLACS